MITTKKCVLCLAEPAIFGGHVHKGLEKVIAGLCKTCNEIAPKSDCKGCYGQWTPKMGYNDPDYGSTYGTDKSPFLKEIQAAGFKPIGITVMTCEETLIFETEVEAKEAYKGMKTNEGWWYGLDGEYPWDQTRKDYVRDVYEGNEDLAPKIYWLRKK